MGDAPASTFTRVTRNAYRSLFGTGDTNLPLEGAVPEAKARKKKQDESQGQAMRMLGALTKGKSPIKK